MKVVAKWNRWVSDQEKTVIASEVAAATNGKIRCECGVFLADEPLTKEESDELMYHPSMGETWYDAGVSGNLEEFRWKRPTSGINYFTHGLSGEKD